MSYASFKQAILLLAASELLLNAQDAAQTASEGVQAEPAAETAALAVAETH